MFDDDDRHPEGCDCMWCEEYEQPCLCCGASISLSQLRDDHCAACIDACDYAGCRLRDRCYGCAGSGVTQGRYIGFNLPALRPLFEQAPCAVCRTDESRAYWLADAWETCGKSAA